jgi:RimJ/RimL family protein N-acetyltransferase
VGYSDSESPCSAHHSGDQMPTRSAGPILETERLILRLPTLDDLDRWAEMMSDPETATFIGGVVSVPITWRVIMQMRGAWELTGISMFSVIDKQRNSWIGRVGPWQPHGWPGAEVGWGLHRDAWGNGYALEAAAASMDFAFDSLGWATVIHCIDPGNAPSQALARRLGSTVLRQARMPAPYEHQTVDVWGQSREEWMGNRAAVKDALRATSADRPMSP